MSSDAVNALVLIIVLAIYVGGLLASAWRLGWLYAGYKLGLGLHVSKRAPFLSVIRIKRTNPPELLKYLVIFLILIVEPWVLIYAVRVLSQVLGIDTTTLLSGNTVWYFITGVPPAIGVLLLVYVVYRVIERHPPDPVERQRRDDYDDLHKGDDFTT